MSHISTELSAQTAPDSPFDELKAFLRNRTQTEILQWALGRPFANTPTTCTPLVLSLDLEWFYKSTNELMEIGMAILDRQNTTGVHRGLNGRNWLSRCLYYHLRVRENAWMKNRYPGGNSEAFQFGRSMFINEPEAGKELLRMFRLPDGKGGYRPVVLLGHAIHNDLNELRRLGMDLQHLDSIVATVDTQVLANQANIPNRGPVIGLTDLITKLDINPTERHNGGNDAAYTLMCAILMVTPGESAIKCKSNGVVDAAGPVPTVQSIVDKITTAPLPGYQTMFCTRCERTNHLRAQCRARYTIKGELIECGPCKRAKRVHKIYASHIESKCLR